MCGKCCLLRFEWCSLFWLFVFCCVVELRLSLCLPVVVFVGGWRVVELCVVCFCRLNVWSLAVARCSLFVVVSCLLLCLIVALCLFSCFFSQVVQAHCSLVVAHCSLLLFVVVCVRGRSCCLLLLFVVSWLLFVVCLLL